jgi:hypothetical protein
VLISSSNLRRARRSPLLALLVLPLFVLAGCSGGGGGGGSSPGTGSSVTITGKVQGTSGNPLEGFVVVYDHVPALKGTSDSKGAIKIVIPVSGITGSDTLSVFDPSGNLAAVVHISPSASSPTYIAPPLTVGPPPPPPV